MKQLTLAAQADRNAFEADADELGGCSCHLHPPCSYCTHPGNPANQAENASCWVEVDEHVATPMQPSEVYHFVRALLGHQRYNEAFQFLSDILITAPEIPTVNPVPHAISILRYSLTCLSHPQPWTLWEMAWPRDPADGPLVWHTLTQHPQWVPSNFYRLRQTT